MAARPSSLPQDRLDPEGIMTQRSTRSTRIGRALVLLPTVVCVSGVVVAVQHGHGSAGQRAVADTTPSAVPSAVPSAAAFSSPVEPAPSAPPTVTPEAAAAPTTVIAGASVTRIRPGHAVSTGAGAVAPLLGRRAPGVATVSQPATSAVAITGIGATALAAYQRAAAVIGQANDACHLDWTLLAGIGEVESGHGTYGGSTLSAAGTATPALRGPVLDGRHHTRLIADTDGGRLDHDTRYDRALGPMQILPATWLEIAVDADGDGRRDPQDINDAALAAAVYLCSAGDDLATPAGARSAVLRYNHSDAYADTVLRLAAGYAQDAALPADVALLPSGGVVSAVDVQPVAAPAPPRHHHAARPARSPHAVKHQAAHHPAGTTWQPASHHAETKPFVPPSEHVAPTPPVPTAPPSSTPAPIAPEDRCRAAIVAAYPAAGPAAVDSAVAACVAGLAGLSDDQAEAALPALIADLPATVTGLDPAPATPTDDASPAAAEQPVSR